MIGGYWSNHCGGARVAVSLLPVTTQHLPHLTDNLGTGGLAQNNSGIITLFMDAVEVGSLDIMIDSCVYYSSTF